MRTNKKKNKKNKKNKKKKNQAKNLQQQQQQQQQQQEEVDGSSGGITLSHAKAAAASMGPGVDPREVQRIYNGFQSDLVQLRKAEPDPLDLLRLKYSMLGKTDWWFIMDECVEQAAMQLKKDNFVVLDGFFGRQNSKKFREQLAAVRKEGVLRLGVLAGGRSGKDLSYQHKKVRGDLVEWFDANAAETNGLTMLPLYMKKIDTFVSELATHIPALRGVSNRSKAMLTCYPGDGARYVKHTDNHCRLGKGNNCNGRRLTTLLYLNEGWVPSDGGQLRLYGGAEGKTKLRDVEPILDRLILFWSDFRVPHEVLPATKDRYASTIWYFDKDERDRALAAGITDTNDGRKTGRVKEGERHVKAEEEGTDSAEGGASPAEGVREKAERERIEREIARFEEKYGGKATVIEGGIGGDTDNDGEEEGGYRMGGDVDSSASGGEASVPVIRSAEGEDVNTESNSISTLPRIQKAVVAKPPSLKSGEAVKAGVVEEVNVTIQPNSAPTAPDSTTLEAPGHHSNMYAEFADFGLDDLE